MPRKPLIRSELLPYHVSARVNNREPFPLPLNVVWEILCFEAHLITITLSCEIQALVLMPNHFHMILTVPVHDLGKVMDAYMSYVTRTINRISGRSGRVFGGPYYRSLIDDPRYYETVFKYVYRNPVKAKLVEAVEEYPFSTLHGLVGKSPLSLPIHHSRAYGSLFPEREGPMDLLEWLNMPFGKENEEAVQKGLRRRVFTLPKDENTRRPREIVGYNAYAQQKGRDDL